MSIVMVPSTRATAGARGRGAARPARLPRLPPTPPPGKAAAEAATAAAGRRPPRARGAAQARSPMDPGEPERPRPGGHERPAPPAGATADAWLTWFATHHQAACRAFLCTQYALNPLDAGALINTACFQVFRHWATITEPLAYFWHTLHQAVAKQGQHRRREQRQLEAYAQQYQRQAHGAERPAQQVADLLEQVSLRQRRLLEWFLQGYDDAQVATWLGTTPQAVRMARYSTYCVLRAQCRLRPGGGGRGPRLEAGANIF